MREISFGLITGYLSKPVFPPTLLNLKILLLWDFPGGAVVKNPPASAGDTGSIPGPGRSHMPRGN